MKAEDAAEKLEALGSTARLSIFRLLVRAGPDGLPVGTIQRRLDMPASTLSHHLHRLVNVGLVTQERAGTSLICRANYAAMDDLLTFMTEECCAEAADG